MHFNGNQTTGGRFAHRPRSVPAMQLFSKTAKFVDHRDPDALGALRDAKTVGPPTATDSNEGSVQYHPLDPNFKSQPKPSQPTAKPVHNDRRLSSAVGNLLGPAAVEEEKDEEEPVDAFVQSKRRTGAPFQNDGIIGGVEGCGDPYQTTTQAANNGDSYTDSQKTGSKKKSFSKFDPEADFISPITGEKMADYGTWAKDLKAKQEKRVEEDSDEEDPNAVDDDPVMTKLRKIMEMRGAKGIIGLARLFRIMDDDRSNSLSFAEFKKATKELKMNLHESEVLLLFKRFDRSNAGSIQYNDFIRAITGKLNRKRKKLVNLAYDVLDKDKSGSVDLADIMIAYDVSRHPDYVAKTRTKEDILREFLDGFDVGGEKDGVVTRKEFENYYTNISASIDTDKYFELMIRNAWHIPGGESECANSANLRVLVTSSSGEEHVTMLMDDLGLKQGDIVDLYARLRKQGVTDVIKINGKPVAAVHGGGGRGTRGSSSSSSSLSSRSGTRGGGKGGSKGGTGSKDGKGGKAAIQGPGIKLLVSKIKSNLKSRGSSGFIGLQRAFKIMDDDGSKSLNRAEFKNGMRDFKMDLSEGDLRMLFDHFDADRSGSISFEEFIQGVRDPLNEARQALVKIAFNIIDRDGSGMVDAKDIAESYDASKHPDVIAKKKKPSEVLTEFLDTFDVGGVKDGQVTAEEFMNYYANIGASIDNDDYFELMMRNAWHIAGGEGAAANSSNTRVMVTDSQGAEKVVTLLNDLGLKQGDVNDICRILKSQGITDVKMIDGKPVKKSVVNGVEVVSRVEPETSSGGTHAQPGAAPPISWRTRPASANATSRHNSNIPSKDSRARSQSKVHPSPVSSNPPSSSLRRFNEKSGALSDQRLVDLEVRKDAQKMDDAMDAVGETLLEVLRNQLLSRGSEGIIDLQRKFVEMDTDGSKALDRNEFKDALVLMKVPFSTSQLDNLFNYFDKDCSGSIDYHELLTGVRGQLSTKILVLVHQAFESMACNGANVISPESVISSYNSFKHPGVLAGLKAEDEVLREFLDTFDVGVTEPGMITRDEFVTYYTNIAPVINDDSYLEIIIRSVWNLGSSSITASRLRDAKAFDSQSIAHAAAQGNALEGEFYAARATARGSSRYTPAGGPARPPPVVSRPSSAPLGRGAGGGSVRSGNNSVSNNDVDVVLEEVAVLRGCAVKFYNQHKYAEAQEVFREMLQMLQAIYPPTHPECVKIEQSILLVQRKR